MTQILPTGLLASETRLELGQIPGIIFHRPRSYILGSPESSKYPSLGIVVGKKKTKTLSDFYIAGGKWGPAVAFVFVFASAVGGAEAVVVGAGAYRSGLSGVWYWWNALFGTVIYFLFSTVYKRSRVFNLADFFEMRYGRQVATLYAVVGVGVCILAVGTFELAVGKIISGLSGLSVNQAVLLASVVVAFYVASGGQMSSLLTDLFQGVLALTAFSFLLLPYLWEAAGGFEGLRTLPPEVWSLESAELTVSYIVALSFSASLGSIVAPYLFGWIVVGKDERTATQCAWGHIWKRVVTLLFALYGILFVVYKPGLDDPEMAWGIVMKELVPPGLLGLLIASFFSALMSTADTMATASSALVADYLFRKRFLPRRPAALYLRIARLSAFMTIAAANVITYYFSTIVQFLEFSYSLSRSCLSQCISGLFGDALTGRGCGLASCWESFCSRCVVGGALRLRPSFSSPPSPRQ